jgi:hypothetical protein
MKIIQPLFIAFALAIAAGAARATAPVYHVKEGYFGKVTVNVSGSCGFKPVTYKNAWMGTLLDSTEAEIGWGIITASGELLFMEENFSRKRYSENIETGIGADISYSNVVGPELTSFITTHSGCVISTIAPDIGSSTKIQWDKKTGLDRVKMNARFSGYEEEVCQVRTTGKQCHAGKFTGSVTFKGNWSTPN